MSDDGITLYAGDCLAILPTLEADSVDAIITDPPYGLGFMGHDWDHGVPGVHFWREVLRVAKPGAHLLAFGGTRTFHRLMTAIEDAGFELRDTLAWLYGSGFPKSLNVAAAIDRARTEDIEPTRVICRAIRAAMDARGLRSQDLTAHFGDCHPRLIDHWAARDSDSQPNLPTLEQWATLRQLLDLPRELDAEVRRLDARKGSPSDVWTMAPVIGEHEKPFAGFSPGAPEENRAAVADKIREPNSEAAAAWQGWGSALKPAWEPIILARKPLEGTIADNVQAFGTGAINIDACRVETAESTRRTNTAPIGYHGSDRPQYETGSDRPQYETGSDLGRWPANVMHDGSEEVVRLFPAEAGAAGRVMVRNADKRVDVSGVFAGTAGAAPYYGDIGSAARFFYTPKASREDRNDGTEEAESERVKRGNFHSTVKPSELMRWCVRLITPPGGIVLDPFMGSGSTGRGAAYEGRRFIGIELDPEYLELARARIRAAARQLLLSF